MSQTFKIIVSILILLLLSACNGKTGYLGRNTTVTKHVGLSKASKKIDKGVYLIVEEGLAETNDELFKKLLGRAAKLTLSKGYKRFVIFSDVKDDEKLEVALQKKKVRKLYLKRITKKSKLIGKTRVLTRERSGMLLSKEMFGVIVMLKGGRAGYPARRVQQVLSGTALFPGMHFPKNNFIHTTPPSTSVSRGLSVTREFNKQNAPKR